jgi:hypothetical protein
MSEKAINKLIKLTEVFVNYRQKIYATSIKIFEKVKEGFWCVGISDKKNV